MLDFLKSLEVFRLAKWQKVVVWILCAIAAVLCVAFLSLKWYAHDRSFEAVFYLESMEEVSDEAESKELEGKVGGQNLAMDSHKSASSDKVNGKSNKKYAYVAKLKFKNVIFSPQRHFSEIEALAWEWKDGVDSVLLENLRVDNRRVRFESAQYIELQDSSALKLGALAYKCHFLWEFLWDIAWRLFALLFIIFALPLVIRAFRLYASLLPPKVALFSKNSAESSAPKATKTLGAGDKAFLTFSLLLIIALFIFQFWLGFPGYHIFGDTYSSIILAKNNAHPVFISYVLQFLYAIFGKHLFYLFLFNLVPFYAGLAFLVCGLYIHFRSKFALLALFPLFIGNIYFQNFVQYHSFSLPMMLFCLYSMLLFLILVPLDSYPKWRKALWVLVWVVMFFAVLWRHNAIFSVYPAFFIVCYLFLRGRDFQNKSVSAHNTSQKSTQEKLDSSAKPNQKGFLYHYFILLVANAVLCVGVVVLVPKVLTIGKAYPTNHLILHKIAGACVPADDSSCFRTEWYAEGKTWENVKEVFYKYPLNADPMNVFWAYDDERPFKHEKLKGLGSELVKAALKYPKNFLKLEFDFIKAMWIQNPGYIFDAKYIQTKPTHSYHVSSAAPFPESERSITFTPLQEKIYTFLFEHKFTLNHIIGVVTSALVMVFSLVLLCAKKEKISQMPYLQALLVFSFSAGFAGFFSAFFIAIFSPVPEPRYMAPVLAPAVLALIGLIASICEYVRYAKNSCKTCQN